MKKVSIKDIANISGYSTATVSRVINDNGRFSEETRSKILKVIEETGYQTNFNAKSLRMNKSYSIGILVPDITNSFFGNIVKEIESLLFEHSYSTIIASTDRDPKKEQLYIDMLVSKMIDGLIIISGLNYINKDEFEFKIDIPFISIDRKILNNATNTLITSDHYQGGVIAANAFFDRSVKYPIILVRDKSTTSTMNRIRGFKDQSIKNGQPFLDEQVVELHTHNRDKNYDAIYKLLTENNQIDGIFAANDELAALILYVAQELKIKVPKKLQIIGFDNTSISRYTNPTISTIEQDSQEIAATAVEQLLYEIDGINNHREDEIIIPVKLIERGSLKKLK